MGPAVARWTLISICLRCSQNYADPTTTQNWTHHSNGWREMLVRIKVTPRGPLAVIGSLPDAKLAILEGLNGIGKSLAIRLLQLCTGTLPYRPDSLAWASLCDGLGPFEVGISGFKDCEQIEWVADSTDWKTRSEPEPTSAWFRSITIGRKPSTLEEVQKLFIVHRMAGDEGIIETFASLADADAATTRRWMQRHAAPKDSPLAALEAKAELSLNLLREWPADRYAQLTIAASTAADELLSAKGADERARSRRDLVTNALELHRQLSELRRRKPGLSKQLAKLDEEISTAQAEREALQHQLSALVARSARAEPVKLELKNARRTLERNRAKLTQALGEATGMASGLGLAAELGSVEAAIGDLEQQVAGLRAEQTALDAAPTMRALLDKVTGDLTKAEESGLGNQVALDDPDASLQLSVSQTRVGMLTRRAFLEGQPPPPQVRDVEQRFTKAGHDLERTRALLAALEKVERFRRLVDTNEQRVSQALERDAGPLTTEAQTLEERRRSKDDDLLRLAAKRAELAQQLGLSSESANEEAIARQLAQALEQVDLTEARLEDEARATHQAAAQALGRLTLVQERVAATRREVSQANAAIKRAAFALSEDRELGWLRRALDGSALVAGDSPEQLLVVIEEARKRIEAVLERLGSHRTQLAAVDRALQAVARGLRGQSPEAVVYVEQLQSWLALRFSEWFNSPRVRRELLPQSDGDIQVDLVRRQVTWHEASGTRSRPLEAFSSGEQAFAYTRARLAVLDETASQPINRLIVLDEFGAFIAHDRLQVLLAYLTDWAKEHVNDQVLIVLPLSRDYATMAKSTVASEAVRFRHLAEQIERHKYAVQVLVQ